MLLTSQDDAAGHRALDQVHLHATEMDWPQALKNRILKEAQSGRFDSLEHCNSPCHWALLRYEKTGDTILHCAAHLGHLSLVRYLITAQPLAVDVKNHDDKTALHEAAQFGQSAIIDILLTNGAGVNALKRADWTPLMLACTKANLESVKLLVNHGALIDYCNKDGWTALHLVARHGQLDIFHYLLREGADFRIKTKNGRTIFHIAALHGNLSIIEAMPLDSELINQPDHCGNTPLHEAVLGGSQDICRHLITRGAKKNSVNKVGLNLLHLAASEADVSMIKYVVDELQLGADWSTKQGLTALHCAARKNRRANFDYLIEIGGDANLTDHHGRSAYDYFINKQI